jgi:glycerophosphoryl diester phosphodiesterase
VALVIAHRTLPLHEAENSLAGIERAGVLGADGVEIDVRITRDGKLVLVHDRTLWRVGRWPLPARWTSFERLRRIKRRDDGLQIPTFAESLEALPQGVLMVIDLKDPRAAMAVIQEVRRQGAEDRVLLWAQSKAAVSLFARELPHVERALLRNTWTARATRRYVEDAMGCNADAISPRWAWITPEFVADAHKRGLKVFAMAQDAESQASRLAAGLDGVVTNWPEQAFAAIRDEQE